MYMHGGEYHMSNPDVDRGAQAAVLSGAYATYKEFARLVTSAPPPRYETAGDSRAPRADTARTSRAAEAYLARFDTAGHASARSLTEAHEALRIAMNRLGARSTAGEGGADPAAIARAHTQDQAGGFGRSA